MPEKDVLEKIKMPEIKKCIKSSGYFMDHRVAMLMRREGWAVKPNSLYKDPFTEKSREIDVIAHLGILNSWPMLDSAIICECKYNKQPMVFFISKSPYKLWEDSVKISGQPLSIIHKNNLRSEFRGFIHIKNHHHYFDKKEKTSQYCSFETIKKAPRKGQWHATHPEYTKGMFDKIINALNHENKNHQSVVEELLEENSPYFELVFYYPLLILKKNIYTAELKDNKLYLNKVNHIKYVTDYINPSLTQHETYVIDVITEDYLNKYLKVVKSEMKYINNKLISNKGVINNTTELLLKAKNRVI